jgi:hypothetical protein
VGRDDYIWSSNVVRCAYKTDGMTIYGCSSNVVELEECYFYGHILFGRGYVVHLVKHHIHINPMY